MPPKKGKGQEKKDEQDGKKKKKVLAKGEGMGGTIGLMEKPQKKCILPCVKSFVQPSACCPQEIRCPVPVCCPPPPACTIMVCPQPTPCCYLP